MNKTPWGSVHQRDFDRPFWLKYNMTYLGHLGIFFLPHPIPPRVCIYFCVGAQAPALMEPQINYEHCCSDAIHLGFSDRVTPGPGVCCFSLPGLPVSHKAGLSSLVLLVVQANANTFGFLEEWILMTQVRSSCSCGKSPTSWALSPAQEMHCSTILHQGRVLWLILIAREQTVVKIGASLCVLLKHYSQLLGFSSLLWNTMTKT